MILKEVPIAEKIFAMLANQFLEWVNYFTRNDGFKDTS